MRMHKQTSIRYNILLLEKLHLQNLLLENRLNWLEQNILPKIKEGLKTGKLNIPTDIQAALDFEAPDDENEPKNEQQIEAESKLFFNWVISLDPEPTKKYVQWMFNCILRKNNPMPVEDLTLATDVLKKFEEAKKEKTISVEQGDINAYKTISDLIKVISKGKSELELADSADRNKAFSESDIIYNSSNYMIIRPKTQFAAEVFGRNSLWCTDWGDPKGMMPHRTSHYAAYTRRGPLYIVIQKNHEQTIVNLDGQQRTSPDTYWQFQFEEKEFTNASNQSINLNQFLKNHHEVDEGFGKVDGKPAYHFTPGVFSLGDIKLYKVHNGYVAKLKPGPQHPVMFRIILSRSTGQFIEIDGFDKFRPQQIDEIKNALNKLEIPGDPNGSQIKGIFYRDNKWGTIADLGKTAMTIGELTWKYITSQNRNYYALITNNNIIMECNIDRSVDDEDDTAIEFTTTKVEKEIWRTTPQKTTIYVSKSGIVMLKPEISDAVTKLFIKSGSQKFGDGSMVSALRLTKQDAKEILQNSKQLTMFGSESTTADLLLLYRADPNGEETKDAFLEWCQEEDLFSTSTRSYPYFIGNKLIVEGYDSVAEMVEDRYSGTANWIMKIINGNETLDIWDSDDASNSDIDNLIESLDQETREKLEKYLEDNDINEYDDEQIRDAANQAMSDGNLIGTENKMYETLRNSVNQNDHILVVNDQYQPISDDKWTWNNTCLFVVDIIDILKLIQNDGYDDTGYHLRNDGWIETLEIKSDFEIEEPRYGFRGFDKSVANEKFSELLDEFLE